MEQLLKDSIKHEYIRQQLEKTTRHAVAHIKSIQELRSKYKVNELIGRQR